MKRIIILLSLFTVLFAVEVFGLEEGVDYIIPGLPPNHWTPPEHIQPGGVELEVIPENYLELYSEEISELVSAVSLTNFDVAISEFDSMPLLGTNGEYRAIAIMFTEGERVQGTFEEYKNMCREITKLEIELRDLQKEFSLHGKPAEQEQLCNAIGDLNRMMLENRIFVAGIYDEELVFLDFANNRTFRYEDSYPESEVNPKSKQHELIAFGILPQQGMIGPDSGIVNYKNRFHVVPIWKVEGETVWDWYIPNEEVIGSWLFYYPLEPNDIIRWVGPRGV